MSTTSALHDMATGGLAANEFWTDGAGQFTVGLVVVAILIGAVWLGMRKRREEPPTPLPEEQPHAPSHQAHIEESGSHSSTEFPDNGTRLTPHQLKGHGNEAPHAKETPRGEGDTNPPS